jgi:hypothetical protein
VRGVVVFLVLFWSFIRCFLVVVTSTGVVVVSEAWAGVFVVVGAVVVFGGIGAGVVIRCLGRCEI